MMLFSDWCQVTLVTHLNQMVQLIEQLLTRAMNLAQTKKSQHAFYINIKIFAFNDG